MGADTAAAVADQLQGMTIDGTQRGPASKAATVAGMDTVLAALRELIGAITPQRRVAAPARGLYS